MTVPRRPAGATIPPTAKAVTMTGPTGRPRSSKVSTIASTVWGRNSNADSPAMATAHASQRAAAVNRAGQYATEKAAAAELRPMTEYSSPAASGVAWAAEKEIRAVCVEPKKVPMQTIASTGTATAAEPAIRRRTGTAEG